MTHNELVRSEGVGGWGLILLVAVIAALFSMLSQPQKNVPLADVAPAATPSAAVALPSATLIQVPAASAQAAPPTLSPTEAALLLHSGLVSAQEICPIVTDHRTALAISLVLRNDTQVTERLQGLSLALPMAGVVTKSVVVRSGTCAQPFGSPVRPSGQVLPAGTTVLATLHLGLPKVCPQPMPVRLDVTVSIGGNVRAEQLSLFNDLGSVRFDTCPKA